MSTLRVHGRSDVGKVRHSNEDHYFIGVLKKTVEVQDTNLEVRDAVTEMARLDAHLLVVADGVGGIAGGRRASQTAVFALATFIGRTAACHYDPDVQQEDEFLQRLEHALHHAHNVVSSLSTPGRGPATTLTMAMVVGRRAYTAHVGDSRAYLLRRGRLRQMTADQTMAAMLEESGVSTDEGDERRLSGILASAVGSQSMTPVIGLVDFEPGDAFLLCTDGLTKHVPDDVIAELLASDSDPKPICDQLVEAALAGGGTDNVTVVVARVDD
jgi:serine/threonine protein phosphatase PrpC